MAQGIFSSVEFLAWARLMKIIFFPKHEESLCLSLFKQAIQRKMSFSVCWLYICVRRKMWGPAGEPLLRALHFWASSSTLQSKQTSYQSQPSGRTNHTAQSSDQETWVSLGDWTYATHRSPSYRDSSLNGALRLLDLFSSSW